MLYPIVPVRPHLRRRCGLNKQLTGLLKIFHLDSKHPSNVTSNFWSSYCGIDELHLGGHLLTTWSPLKIMRRAAFSCIDFPVQKKLLWKYTFHAEPWFGKCCRGIFSPDACWGIFAWSGLKKLKKPGQPVDQLPEVGLYHWLELLNCWMPHCLRMSVRGGRNSFLWITRQTCRRLSGADHRDRNCVLAWFSSHIFGRMLKAEKY